MTEPLSPGFVIGGHPPEATAAHRRLPPRRLQWQGGWDLPAPPPPARSTHVLEMTHAGRRSVSFATLDREGPPPTLLTVSAEIYAALGNPTHVHVTIETQGPE